jgi:hypothetical protein
MPCLYLRNKRVDLVELVLEVGGVKERRSKPEDNEQ